VLERKRTAVSPILKEMGSIPGVEIEDKRWSVAIHYRNASPRSFRKRTSLLQRLRERTGIKVYRGPEVMEVQLVPGGGKSAGVRRLCRIIDWDPSRERIVYAGDDENDAVAIRWVLSNVGDAIVVGNRITVPHALHVEGPADLARAVRDLGEAASMPAAAMARGGTA
jgi:trehalose 6-phosphate phosphatase